ncbi:MAG: hypothetical protein WC533_04230 [Candidatus Pacearchaeota archaeon]
MLKIKKISETVGKKVYTDEGNFFGEIEEANLVNNKVDSWRIRLSSGIANTFSGARGVIIPHNYVKSVGDVFVVSQIAMPSQQSIDEMPDLS